jgi:hypothetical protein
MLNKLKTKFKIIGDIPSQHPAESSQFERVLDLLRSASDQMGPWSIAVLDIPYYHKRGKKIDYDRDWNSQIDILLLSEHRIIAYELKGFTAKIIKGTTDKTKWKIKRWNSSKSNKVLSFFDQASKHHAYLVSDFFPKYRDNNIHLSKNHWIVDARVVLKPESDLSGFFYKYPQTIYKESLRTDVLDNISSTSEFDFIIDLYSGYEQRTGKLSAKKVSTKDYQRANEIFRDNCIPIRTEKWFRLLTENQIQPDISQTGSNRFYLDWESAMNIAIQLKKIS